MATELPMKSAKHSVKVHIVRLFPSLRLKLFQVHSKVSSLLIQLVVVVFLITGQPVQQAQTSSLISIMINRSFMKSKLMALLHKLLSVTKQTSLI